VNIGISVNEFGKSKAGHADIAGKGSRWNLDIFTTRKAGEWAAEKGMICEL